MSDIHRRFYGTPNQSRDGKVKVVQPIAVRSAATSPAAPSNNRVADLEAQVKLLQAQVAMLEAGQKELRETMRLNQSQKSQAETDETEKKSQPWVEAGMSKTSWYRQRAKKEQGA